jgi:SAM-dependent methyltransferase
VSTAAAAPSRLLHGLVIAPAAFLLFQVQPMAAKAILPWFGGSAAVWITCLLFFQVGLLAGYLYAHGLIRFLAPGKQAAVHSVLLLAAMATLPVNPSAGWKPLGMEDPSLRILGLLAVSIGLPYVLLAATSPLLQAWYARSHPEGLPWGLFALSNAGSLAALLTYPVAIEPFLGVRRQMHVWSIAFGAVALLCVLVSWRAARALKAVTVAAPPGSSPRRADTAMWVLLAACASALLMAVSNHLTQNVASVPFLWVLPLSVYLFTFFLCFDGRGWYRRGTFLPLLFLLLGGMTLLMGPDTEGATLWLILPVFLAGMFVCCMVCHGELARMRPHPAHLTTFYLCLAAGGALGGMFVGLVAPRIFSGYWELPIGLAACAALALAAVRRDPPARIGKSLFRTAWGVAAFAGVMIAAGLAWQSKRIASSQRLMVRDFYGGLRVADRQSKDGNDRVRMLLHGIINHGEQFLDAKRALNPTSYYSPWSGAALAITREPRPASQRIGIVGLGTGTLASYGRSGDVYRFYEISPLIVELARSEFTYLADSPARSEVVLGDGRLALDREPDQHFDVLVVDAFAGDAIPTHLLTREAFEMYRRHLNPGGTLAIHITNRYLDLAPIVAQGAELLGLKAIQIKALPDEARFWRASTWVLVTAEPEHYLLLKERNVAVDLVADPGRRPWTDDYSELFGIVKQILPMPGTRISK